jgi:ATP-dependent protease HslVU (ClpYQ) peptidase subunit
MTCIIGLESEGSVFVGGDSAASAGNMVRAVAVDKVFQRGPFLIGYTTSFRMGQILRYQVDFPPTEVYDEAYMVCEFVEAVRAKFKELGFTRIENNEETGGNFIVGVAGKVWQIESDFQVSRSNDGMAAIGAGSNFALGALMALHDLPPKKRILEALSVSAWFCGYVTLPFKILET